MRPRSATLATLEKAYRIVRQIDETALDGYEITMREVTILEAITQGASDVPSIAARLGVSSHATKQIVERMEARRIVQRVKVAGRRAFAIGITKDGTKILDHHRTLDKQTSSEVERRLGAEAVRLIARLGQLLTQEPDVLVPATVNSKRLDLSTP